jgi:ATP-dependent RNA helicase DeaD
LVSSALAILNAPHVTGAVPSGATRPTRKLLLRPIPDGRSGRAFYAKSRGYKELELQTTTMTKTTETSEGFRDLGLSPTALTALERAGYHTPSPVQTLLIPPALEGRDCLGNAPTGTGKTAAFLLPILERVDERERSPQALILAPTRELVVQICREFEKLARGRRTRAVAVVGGESITQQQRLLAAGCQLVVATPGRLIDLMDRRTVRLDKVQVVVLDEADQMLDIGFRPAVERVMASVPAGRQTLLLSATMPTSVRSLAKTYLKDPADVRLIKENEDATIPAIRQSYVMVESHRKFELLVKLLQREQPTRAIVFCRTKHGADKVGTMLMTGGFQAGAMHGNLSQSQRNRVIQAFHTGRLTTLVATDVVGRGIDVRGVSHVINFDVPEVAEHYIHRIGRTGRMGNDGAAFTFVVPEQAKLLDQIERLISREIECDQVEGIHAPTRPRPMSRRPTAPVRRGAPRTARTPRPGASFGAQRRRRLGSPQGVG